uniref:Uncharacterized protein n=1 Tax=Anguilla anguilla TaxID=7936 RepID=A0A0E9S7B5_ANGAN
MVRNKFSSFKTGKRALKSYRRSNAVYLSREREFYTKGMRSVKASIYLNVD